MVPERSCVQMGSRYRDEHRGYGSAGALGRSITARRSHYVSRLSYANRSVPADGISTGSVRQTLPAMEHFCRLLTSHHVVSWRAFYLLLHPGFPDTPNRKA